VSERSFLRFRVLGYEEGEIVVSQRSFFRFRVLGHEKGEIVVI